MIWASLYCMEATTETTETISYEDVAEKWNVNEWALYYWATNQRLTPEELIADYDSWDFEEAYLGETSLYTYALEYAEGVIADDFALRYFDVERFVRDLRFDGYWEQDGHAFRC